MSVAVADSVGQVGTESRPRAAPGGRTKEFSETMRILFTACPFFGHVNTVLPLALTMRRAGHDVVVATGADFAAHVERRGLEAWPIGPTSAEAGTPRSPDHFFHTAAQRAADLLPLTEAWPPDLVVSEEMELAGAIAATRSGIRYVVHGLGISATGEVEVFAGGIDELGRRWGVPDLARFHRGADYLSICPPTLQPPIASERTVQLLRPGLGEPAPGERLPEAFAALPHEQTVHLTLGTVFHRRRPGVLETAIAGLRELPANLVVTVGPDVDPDRLGPQPPHVVVERYVPHALLLPRCDLVVSQGGAGILFGALAHGLPQLVLPQGADQFANGEAAQRAGLALVLDGAEVTQSAITEAADRLLGDPRYAAAARAVRNEIDTMPRADDVVASLTAGPAPTAPHQRPPARGDRSSPTVLRSSIGRACDC
jgi:UDP:flavonoid glycosyltransferase YjiC (YdhE family)